MFKIDFHAALPGAFMIPFVLGYPIPALVAWRRRGLYMAPAIAVDLLLAWTFIGWGLALWFALSKGRTRNEPAQAGPWTIEYPAGRR